MMAECWRLHAGAWQLIHTLHRTLDGFRCATLGLPPALHLRTPCLAMVQAVLNYIHLGTDWHDTKAAEA